MNKSINLTDVTAEQLLDILQLTPRDAMEEIESPQDFANMLYVLAPHINHSLRNDRHTIIDMIDAIHKLAK